MQARDPPDVKRSQAPCPARDAHTGGTSDNGERQGEGHSPWPSHSRWAGSDGADPLGDPLAEPAGRAFGDPGAAPGLHAIVQGARRDAAHIGLPEHGGRFPARPCKSARQIRGTN